MFITGVIGTSARIATPKVITRTAVRNEFQFIYVVSFLSGVYGTHASLCGLDVAGENGGKNIQMAEFLAANFGGVIEITDPVARSGLRSCLMKRNHHIIGSRNYTLVKTP
jgi:hypothetical protein